MQGPSESTFRPTVVAAPPMAAPPVLVGAGAVLLNEHYIGGGDPTGLGSPLPDDFSLQELLAVDLDDPAAILELHTRYGVVASFARWTFDYLPMTETNHGPFPGVLEQLAQFAATVPDVDWVLSVEAARLHLHAARAMSRHLLAHLEGDQAAILEAWRVEGFDDVTSGGEAWLKWTNFMNAALTPFRMYMEVIGDEETTSSGWEITPPTLHSACALQLAQYVSTDAQVSFCANDRCRKPFTRQRAPVSRRRNADQFHTSGVLYCSRECLKRKSEQDRRNRRKAEKQEGTS